MSHEWALKSGKWGSTVLLSLLYCYGAMVVFHQKLIILSPSIGKLLMWNRPTLNSKTPWTVGKLLSIALLRIPQKLIQGNSLLLIAGKLIVMNFQVNFYSKEANSCMKNFSSFLALIIEFACFRSGWLSKWPFFEVAHSKLSLLSEWLFSKRCILEMARCPSEAFSKWPFDEVAGNTS